MTSTSQSRSSLPCPPDGAPPSYVCMERDMISMKVGDIIEKAVAQAGQAGQGPGEGGGGAKMMHAAGMDVERFISEVAARPGIWQVNHPEHKNKMFTKKLWAQVQLKFPHYKVDDLKKRWKNLKDTYRKEVKRLPQQSPGIPDDNFTSGWRYYNALHFLRYHLGFNRRELDDVSQPEQDKYFEASSQSPASPASSKSEDDEKPDTPSVSKRKESFDIRAELLKIERKKIKILEEEVSKSNEYMKSDNYHFLMSLLPEMEKLGPLQKMRLRAKISQAVLDELSMESYDNHINQHDSQQNFNELPMHGQLNYEPDSHVAKPDIVKEEAINMYD